MTRQILLALFIFSWRLVAGDATQYRLLGETVTFNTGITKTISDILWKHNKNKVVEFNGNQQQEYKSFEHRVTLDWHSADLSISDLGYEDSGTYMLDVYIDNVLDQSSYTLKVIDKVTKPTISCETNTDTNKSGHQAKLTCSAEPTQSPSLMQFEWTSHGQPGPQLTIPLGDEHDEEVYNCTVKYYVTQDSATFTAKDCYGKSSTGQIVGIIVGVAAIIGLVVLCIYCKLKYKAKKNNDEESALSAPDVTQGSIDEKGDKESRKPLLHRSSTRPSEQKLSHLNRHREDRESVQDSRNEDTINKQVQLPPKDVENHKGRVKKSRPTVPEEWHSQVCPHKNEDTENEPADSVEATDEVLPDEQAEDTQHQIADDPQSSTASQQPDVENHAVGVTKTPFSVSKKPDEQTEDTQHQAANDLQSSTASEQPDVENRNGSVKKSPPPVPKKQYSQKRPENEPTDSVEATDDVLFDEQTEDTQHQIADDAQSSTASEQPGVENHEDKVQKTPPPVPKDTSSVGATADVLTEDTQHQMADDTQSTAVSEQPDVENRKGSVKKSPPPVPKKQYSQKRPHKNEDRENEPALATDDVLPDEQTEDTQHQRADDPLSSSMAKKNPPPVPKKRKSQSRPKNTSSVGATADVLPVSDSTELKEGNKLGDLSTEQEGKEGEEATAHEQNSKTDTAEDNQQEEKMEDISQPPHQNQTT